jgi:hypothetical protein
MRVVPAPAAVTTPVADTVATTELSDDQLMARPVRMLPPASVGVAVAVVVVPATIDDCARATEMLAIGGGPVGPPPPPQPNVARHNAIAVRTRSGIGTSAAAPTQGPWASAFPDDT